MTESKERRDGEISNYMYMQWIIKKKYAKEIHDLYEVGYDFKSKKVLFAFIWCVDRGHFSLARRIFMHREIEDDAVIMYCQDLCAENNLPGVKFFVQVDVGLWHFSR